MRFYVGEGETEREGSTFLLFIKAYSNHHHRWAVERCCNGKFSKGYHQLANKRLFSTSNVIMNTSFLALNITQPHV
jgi:hypothetical protein